ncbi:MAG: gamma-glutamyltransferase [Planctomycetota bacterium]
MLDACRFLSLHLLLAFGIALPTTAAEVSEPSDAVVVAAHPTAAQAGITILERGGNAIDAAVATALTLGVAEPWGSGLGGKLIMVYYDAKAGRAFVVESLDQASRSIDVEAYAALPTQKKRYGATAAAVPGMLAGWSAAHRRWGTLQWADLVQPAVDAAENGVVADRYDTSAANTAEDKLIAGQGAEVFLPNGEPPGNGDLVRYPDLARTLRIIRDQGPGAMYGGPIGEAIARHVQDAGGWMTPRDFATFRPYVGHAPSVEFRGRRVAAGAPPATGGASVLLTLACLDLLPEPAATDAAQRHAETVDATARVIYHVYPIVRAHLGGRAHPVDSLRRLLQRGKIRDLARAVQEFDPSAKAAEASPIRSRRALASILLDERLSCTSHFIVADAHGNVVCATQSLGHHFGSGVVVPGTGIVLNNSMNNFATRTTRSPNYLGPGIRARSTMAPTLVIGDDGVELALGVPGGQRIPTGVLHVLRGILDEGLTAEEAVDRPRVHVRDAYNSEAARREVHLEAGPGVEALEARLEAAGWDAQIMEESMMYFGGVNVLTRSKEQPGRVGRWVGVGDDRRTNAALGLNLSVPAAVTTPAAPR